MTDEDERQFQEQAEREQRAAAAKIEDRVAKRAVQYVKDQRK